MMNLYLYLHNIRITNVIIINKVYLAQIITTLCPEVFNYSELLN